MQSLLMTGTALVHIGGEVPGSGVASDTVAGEAGLKLDVLSDVLFALDRFSDADGTPLNFHTMDVGGAWVAGGAVVHCVGNRAEWQSGSRFIGTTVGRADVLLQATLTGDTGDGLVVRFTDDDNGIVVFAQANHLYVYQVEAGTFTLLSDTTLDSSYSTQTLRVNCNGDTITARLLEDPNIAVVPGVAFQDTSEVHGLFSTTAAGGNWDDFSIRPPV